MKLDKHKFRQLILNKLAEAYLETGKTTPFDTAAIEIGISKPTISRVLKGKMFDIDTWLKICTWLEIDINEVILK